VLYPVAGFSPVWQLKTDFEAFNGLPGRDYAPELGLYEFGKIAENLTNTLSDMRSGWYAIHFR
jgi:hypothetical protein